MKDRYDFFLSGPTGNVANYKERFAEAERILHDVFGRYVRIWNPALLPPGKTRRWYMERCLVALWRSSTVCMLPGWAASQGAMIEVTTARYIGVNIDTAVLRNLKPEPLFENKETGVLWSVQF